MNDRSSTLARAIENERNVNHEVSRILENEDLDKADTADRLIVLFDRLDDLEDQIEFLRSTK